MKNSPTRSLTPLIVLAMMILGGFLAVTWPIWISPPNTASTIWLYIGLLLVVFTLQERRSKAVFFLLLVVGIITTVFVPAISGSNISVWAIEAKNCTSSEVSLGQTEHVCTIWSIFNHQIFTLQGPTGSPLARLVSNKTIFTQ